MNLNQLTYELMDFQYIQLEKDYQFAKYAKFLMLIVGIIILKIENDGYNILIVIPQFILFGLFWRQQVAFKRKQLNIIMDAL